METLTFIEKLIISKMNGYLNPISVDDSSLLYFPYFLFVIIRFLKYFLALFDSDLEQSL